MYDNDFINSLKSKITLSDVVSRSVKLINKGRDKVACCPFHREKTPSFHVSDEKGFYHCFGCGAHGDIITFTMQQDGLSFKEAVEKLASENGIELPKLVNNKQMKDEVDKNKIIYTINQKTCEFFHNKIFNEEGRAGLLYISKRGLKTEDIKKFKIGFAPEGFNNLISYLKNFNISEKEMEMAGVVVKNNNGNYYDKFRNRVMFPVFDKSGKVIAFTGRVINKNDMPKYMNSPETPIYHKSDVLFNYFFARKGIYDNKKVILVEGNLDAITLAINGIENVVAPMGTAITLKQIDELWKITNEIVVCLDGDTAGQKASLRLANLVLSELKPTKNISFVSLPEEQDPDDFVKNNGKNGFIEYIENTQNCLSLSEFLWKNELSSLKSIENNGYLTPEDKTILEINLQKITSQIKDPLVAKNFEEFYRKQIFIVSKYDGSKKIKNYRNTTKIDYRKNIRNLSAMDLLKTKIINVEKQIFYLIINYPLLIDKIFTVYNVDILSMEYFDNNSHNIINIISKLYEDRTINNSETLINILEKNNFNDYIIGSKRYNTMADDKKVDCLYSLVIEKNINMLEVEIKNLSITNDNESRRKIIIDELENLRKKKSLLDEEF